MMGGVRLHRLSNLRRGLANLRHRLVNLHRGLADAGHVAVEYALTFPILLGLLYGIMEVSHYAFIQLTVSNSAHDATRYAIVHSSISNQPLQSSDIQTYATNALSGYGLTAAATVQVTYTPNNKPGSSVKVQISYPFAPFMPGFNQIPGTSSTFTNLVGPISTGAQMVLSQ